MDAGPDKAIMWPANTVSINAIVTDDGLPLDPGAVSLLWEKLSGPGDATFAPNGFVEDSVVTFSAAGLYELQLTAFDGERDTVDTVLVEVDPNYPVHNRTQGTNHPTIQEAINQGVNGDLIEVDPGTYALTATIDFAGKAITLRSLDPNDPDVVAATILDGQNSVRVIQCISREWRDTVLSGFTITSGFVSAADYRGDGMYNVGSSPTVINCIFTGNYSTRFGGGMYSHGGSPTVKNCTFVNNRADSFGGGMYTAGSRPTITNCSFNGNWAGYYGGGMYNNKNGGSFMTATKCTFTGNSAGYSGGGMYNRYFNPVVSNCSFSNNTVGEDGGGIYNYRSHPAITNCTFSGSSADRHGGSMRNYNYESLAPTVVNSIFWSNDPNEISSSYNPITVSFSDIAGGLQAGSIDGGGNINADPLFVDIDGPDDNPNTYEDNDYRLSAVSPCIDAGNTYIVLDASNGPDDAVDSNSFDLAGRVRKVDDLNTVDTGIGGPPVVDMGAYEFQGCDGNLDTISGVHLGDFANFTSHWLQTDCGDCGSADFDGDQDVGIGDLMIQAVNWLCDTN